MARKIKAKLIMELCDQGVSRRSIAKIRHMSMESVCDVFDIADERGITWEQVAGMTDDEAYRLFYPDKHVRESIFEEPDWGYVHAEMAKVGINLRLLHDEYKADCAKQHKITMGYTRWCERYAGFVVANNITKRIEHKAGQSCEVEWSLPVKTGKDHYLSSSVIGNHSRSLLFAQTTKLAHLNLNLKLPQFR